MYQLQATLLHFMMSLTPALYCVIVFQTAAGQEASTGPNCTSLTESENGLEGTNCTLSADQKGLVGVNCTTVKDCFEGLQCAPNKTCACPEGCEYIAQEVACSCGSEWADSNVIIFLTIGVPFNALIWFGCFYRTKKIIKREKEDDDGSQSTIMKAGAVDSVPLAPVAPTAPPGGLFAVSEAGFVARAPPQPPQWGSQMMGSQVMAPSNGLPLDTVPPPPAYYPQQF